MKSVKDIKQYIRSLKVKSSDEIHLRVLNKLLIKMDKSKTDTTAKPLPIWKTITKNPITKFAAAAAIIIATSFFFIQNEQPGEIQTQQIAQAAKSPAELTTFASLSFAYRQGGMEKVEKICDKAISMAGPNPTCISIQEFFENNNNKNSER